MVISTLGISSKMMRALILTKTCRQAAITSNYCSCRSHSLPTFAKIGNSTGSNTGKKRMNDGQTYGGSSRSAEESMQRSKEAGFGGHVGEDGTG